MVQSLRANRSLPDRERVNKAISALNDAGVLRSEFLIVATKPQSDVPLFKLLVELGRVDLSVARLYEGHVNAFQLVARFGDKTQLARANHIVNKGGLLGVWGADNPNLPGRIELVKDVYRLGGGKTFASGVEVVSMPLIAIKKEHRVTQLVLMDRHFLTDRIDLTSWNPIGMKATGSYNVDLNGIVGGLDDLLGPPGVYETQPFFGGGASRFVSAQLGGLISVFDATVTHLQTTARFENAHQAVRLGQMLAEASRR